MTTMYVSDKTTTLSKSSNGKGKEMVLIFGDEVETSGEVVSGRIKSDFRGKEGYLLKNELSENPVLEIYFIDVGQGESTFIVTPGRKKILIDGGINKRAYGFLTWKYKLDEAESPLDIDLLVLSHADEDHINGLIPIIRNPKIRVKKVIHNGIATYKKGVYQTGIGDLIGDDEYLVTRHNKLDDVESSTLTKKFKKWIEANSDEKTQYSAVDSTSGVIDIGDPEIKISVLGPRLDSSGGSPVYEWFDSKAKTINGHSVVLKIEYKSVSAIFTGDLNEEGEKRLMKDPLIEARLESHIFKAPHHGSHDFHLPALEKIKPQISVVSSGDNPDHGHPRASLLGALGKVSRSATPLLFSTEIAATFWEVPGETDDETESDLNDLNLRASDAASHARKLFKRRLHGMINVRTDGEKMYAARRVASNNWWEAYGPITPE